MQIRNKMTNNENKVVDLSEETINAIKAEGEKGVWMVMVKDIHGNPHMIPTQQ